MPTSNSKSKAIGQGLLANEFAEALRHTLASIAPKDGDMVAALAKTSVNLRVALEGYGEAEVKLGGAVAFDRSGETPLPLTATGRIAKAKDLLKSGKVYEKGCSEFICDVLGVPWQSANDLMGANPTDAGSNNAYNLKPGDIAGWKKSGGSGHVTLFIGEGPGKNFIDVKEDNAHLSPRSISGYGPQALQKSSRS